jgi:actin-related protein
LEQKMIMKARFEGKAFWEIEEDKHRFVTDEIILSMASISGCKMPETELLASYVSREMVRIILDFGYEELTVAEIVLAFRINTQPQIVNRHGDDLTSVEPSAIVCSSFLANVLRNYKILRSNLDASIERKIMGY